jgi:uncharacterized protein
MASRKALAFQTRAFVIALLVMAGSTTCGPVLAQFWGDRPSGGSGNHRSGGWGWDDWGDRHRQRPGRDFFPFFGERYDRPAPAVDNSKAPAPRKLETPPTSTVVVVGDSMADWLGYGLDELYSEQPETAVERKIRASSGLVRYDTKNETLDWPQAVKDALANEKPDAIVVILGLNDRVPLRDKTPPTNANRAGEPAQAAKQTANQAPQAPQDKTTTPADSEAPQQPAAQADTKRPVPGGSYEFQTDPWATLYAKRIDEMIAALKSKGVPIVWVGLPAIRGTKATSDMSYLNELYRERAEKAGIVYIDIWDGFIDDEGRYAVQGPDFEGQVRRLRTADGVHFTKAGAVKLASYVDRELRRVMSTHLAPVALPALESVPKSGAADARPDVGPVLPLSSGGGEHGDLVGAADHSSQKTSDPIAAKVLSRGEVLAAPTGRADDFSWPRPGAGASTTPDIAPQPTALSPAASSKKVDEVKKPTVGKDNKNKPGKESRVSKTRAIDADLDGAPVPPAPVGSR